MKKKFAVILAASLILNAYLVLSRIDISAGGGLGEKSPNEEHVVTVSSLRNFNPLGTNTNHYGKITIRDGLNTEKIIREFTVSPIKVETETAYRELEDAIQWSEDSRSVTVRTPEFSITANLTPEPISDGNAEKPLGIERKQ